MKSIIKAFGMLAILTLCISVTSCGSDDEDTPKEMNHPEIYDQFFNTSWQLTSSKTYHSENSKTEVIDHLKQHPSFAGMTLNFTDEIAWEGQKEWYKMTSSRFSGYGAWFVNEKGELLFTVYAGQHSLSDKERINFESAAGTGGTPELINGGTQLRFVWEYESDDSDYRSSHVEIFTRLDYQGDNNSGSSGNNSGSSNKYEKPELGFSNFTATNTSLFVEYKILNSKDCGKIKSAKIYYGQSAATRSVNATVTGVVIRARISGLKAGTSYYVKCSATGEGGTSTTGQTKCITNF